jgi:hypothetical protein
MDARRSDMDTHGRKSIMGNPKDRHRELSSRAPFPAEPHCSRLSAVLQRIGDMCRGVILPMPTEPLLRVIGIKGTYALVKMKAHLLDRGPK